jgi:hypothetical protein
LWREEICDFYTLPLHPSMFFPDVERCQFANPFPPLSDVQIFCFIVRRTAFQFVSTFHRDNRLTSCSHTSRATRRSVRSDRCQRPHAYVVTFDPLHLLPNNF